MSAARPAVPPGRLPEAYLNLLARIVENPDRLRQESAFEILRRAGLAADFDDLFGQAEELNLGVDAVAVLILVLLLEGPLERFLPDPVRAELAPLQARARTLGKTIDEVGSRCLAVSQLLSQPAARELLRCAADVQAVERLGRLPQFHFLLKRALSRSAEQATAGSANAGATLPESIDGCD